MKNVNYIVFLVLLLGSIGCEGDYDIGYHFSGLEGVHAENSSGKPQTTLANSILKDRYVLRLNLFPVEEYRHGRYLDTETPPRNLNPIIQMIITADNRYNDTLFAGDTLNNCFRILNGSYLNTSDLNQLTLTNVYSDDYYDHPIPEYADLLMLIPPDSARNYRFQIQILLKDSTRFYDTTSVIYLY